MPTYDYKCAECGHIFEEFQPISSHPLTECPSCGKKSLRRILGGGGGMIFKGQGFYLTDYKNSGGKKKSEGQKTESPGKTAGSDGNSAKKDPVEKKP